MPATPPLLELRGLAKRYGTLLANDAVDLSIRPGDIHAILGENGAGKSTLMKMIFGVEQPDSGEILWKGDAVSMQGPADALRLGIGMVFQHFSLFETVSVTDNISLTVPGSKADLARRISEKADEFGLPIDPNALVHSLSVGERQRAEIIRVLLQEPQLLILDEPTSILPPANVRQLFETLRRLSERGIAILYISHKLEEIRELCQAATVLRRGRVTGRVDPTATSAAELASLMIGRDVPHARHTKGLGDGKYQIVVRNLSFQEPDPHVTGLKNVDLAVREGEIVGIAGISGNGQSTLARVLSGEIRLARERNEDIWLRGKSVGSEGPLRRRRLGLCFVPEERLGRGAVPEMSLSENALLTAHWMGMVKAGLIDRRRSEAFSGDCIVEMGVRASGPSARASSLSGGNLQKFIVGREMRQDPKVLVVSQPTWGIDVGAAALVRQRLVDLRDKGAAILVISEELDELFEISDRLLVICNGYLSKPLMTGETTPEKVGEMMMGSFLGVEAAA